MLIGFRFLAGVFGSAPLVNGMYYDRSKTCGTNIPNLGGGSIADIFIQEKRGTAMALFSMGPIIGPVSKFGSRSPGFLASR